MNKSNFEMLRNLYYRIDRECVNPKDVHYKNYGAIGIKLCDEWKSDKRKFIEWCLANGFEKGKCLVLKDCHKDFMPGNCRFVDRSECITESKIESRYAHLIGKRFGLWTVKSVFLRKRSDVKRLMCHCVCDCGTERDVFSSILFKGQSKSCGCLHTHHLREKYKELYNTWKSIKARCRDKRKFNFNSYKKKGVKVAKEWIDNPIEFVSWSLKNGWRKGLEIDRIDNNGDYSPSNCRWVSHKINCRNKGNNHRVIVRGKMMCISEISETFNLPYCTVKDRIYRGLRGEQIIKTSNTPIDK